MISAGNGLAKIKVFRWRNLADFTSTKIILKKGEIMKTFRQIADQCERIARLYEKGFGTKKMLEKAEKVFFSVQNVGMCF